MDWCEREVAGGHESLYVSAKAPVDVYVDLGLQDVTTAESWFLKASAIRWDMGIYLEIVEIGPVKA